jgi:DNA-binding response OmpR family regulator
VTKSKYPPPDDCACPDCNPPEHLFGGVFICEIAKSVVYQGVYYAARRQDLALMRLLLSRPKRVFAPETIAARVGKSCFFEENGDRCVACIIKHARQSLKTAFGAGAGDWIGTRYGIGYHWAGPVA